jgi:mRNA interferase MazF
MESLTGDPMLAQNDGMMPDRYIPDRGDFVWLQLDPQLGHEQSGRRPALVLSRKLMAEKTGLVVMCPITNKPTGRPNEVAVSTARINGAVLPIHIRSVDYRARETAFISQAPEEVLAETSAKVALLVNGQ